MTGRTIGAVGFAIVARKAGIAAISEPPPKALTRNVYERQSVAEQENSHDSVGLWGGARLHLLQHFDNELFELIVEQVLCQSISNL